MTTSIDDMRRRLPGMEADVRMYQERLAELRAANAEREARIDTQRAALERARAENAALKARIDTLETRIATLESGPEPIQCSMGRPTRANGATARLEQTRPLFAQALARRDALMDTAGLTRAQAWERLMREEPGLREALIREAADNGGGER